MHLPAPTAWPCPCPCVQHFDASLPTRRGALAHAASERLSYRPDPDSSVQDGSVGGGLRSAAAARSRLARASAPAGASGQHFKSVSWGGEQAWGPGGSPRAGGGSVGASPGLSAAPSMQAAAAAVLAAAADGEGRGGAASQRRVDWEVAAAAAAAAVDGSGDAQQPAPVSLFAAAVGAAAPF